MKKKQKKKNENEIHQGDLATIYLFTFGAMN